MRRLLSLPLAVFLVGGVAAVADAAPLKWEGTLVVELGQLPPVRSTGGGVATVNGSAGGLHLSTLALAGGITGSRSVPVTDPEVTAEGITSVRVTATLGTGTLGAISGTGPLNPSTLPVFGLALVCLSDPECNPVAGGALPVLLNAGPSTGVGLGGLLTLGGLGDIRISIVANPWTIGVASALDELDGGTIITRFTTGFAHGPQSLTSSTAQPSGVVKFVTPLQISTNITGGSNSVISAFTTLTLHFVPEPGMLLLLGSGVVGLVLLGRQRMQG
jgi:hypothetical protein